MLEVSIYKKYPGFTLDIGFEAERGTMALLGASGCGKSMTLKCIAGIITPDRGRIVLNGRVLFDSERRINLTPQKRKVGYLFQHYSLFPNMTALGNIMVGARSKKGTARHEAVSEAITTLKLSGLEGQWPHELSGGQRQRVALARILVSDPEILLLDEPFSALDDYLKWQVELDLSAVLREFQGPSLFVSHNRDEVFRLCKSVCVLSGGRSEPRREVPELFERPETLAASLISGCKNYSRVQKTGDCEVYAQDWDVTLKLCEPVPDETEYIGVRAHFIKPAEMENAENVFRCEVLNVIDNVFSMIIMLKTPGGGDEKSRLRMEMSKEEWLKSDGSAIMNVRVSPSDVMPLRG